MGSACLGTEKPEPAAGENSDPDFRIERLREEESRDMVARLQINQALFEIDFDELDIQRSIGEGGSDAVIFKATWHETAVAFKCFKLNDFDDQDRFGDFEKEVGMLGSLSHPNLVRFFGATIKPPRVGIVMQFCPNGDVLNYLTRNPDSPLSFRVRILVQVASGMSYLHGKNIMHRDLKPENVLLDENLVVKLIDFGFSRVLDGINKTKRVGTSHYMAPEITTSGRYDERVDIFSFAMTAFEVLTNNFNPFGSEDSEFGIELRIANAADYRPSFEGISSEKIPAVFVEMVERSWSVDPEDRPDFSEIVQVLKGEIASLPPLKTRDVDKKGNSSPSLRAPVEEEEGEEDDVEYLLRKVPFDSIPGSAEEFADLREAREMKLRVDLEGHPSSLKRYARACLGASFFMLALLVYQHRGPETGLACLGQTTAVNFSSIMGTVLRVQASQSLKRLLLRPDIPSTFVFSPESDHYSVHPSSSPPNDFEFWILKGDRTETHLEKWNHPTELEKCCRTCCCTLKCSRNGAPMQQRFFKCHTCSGMENDPTKGLCLPCAMKCHYGHDVRELSSSPMSSSCQCGEGMFESGEIVPCVARTEEASPGIVSFALKVACTATAVPKTFLVTRTPFFANGNFRVISFEPLRSPFRFPSPISSLLVRRKPERFLFDHIPRDLADFLSVRSDHENTLDERVQEDEGGLFLLDYFRSSSALAFYVLSLLVCVKRGMDVGLPCVVHSVSDSLTVVNRNSPAGGRVLRKAALAVLTAELEKKPSLPISFVRSAADRKDESPDPSTDPFAIEVLPCRNFAFGCISKYAPKPRSWVFDCRRIGCCPSIEPPGSDEALSMECFVCETCQNARVCLTCAEQCHMTRGHIVEKEGRSKFICECLRGCEDECTLRNRSVVYAHSEFVFRLSEKEKASLECSVCICSRSTDDPKTVPVSHSKFHEWMVVQQNFSHQGPQFFFLLDNDIEEPEDQQELSSPAGEEGEEKGGTVS